jgi:hypothetical protein
MFKAKRKNERKEIEMLNLIIGIIGMIVSFGGVIGGMILAFFVDDCNGDDSIGTMIAHVVVGLLIIVLCFYAFIQFAYML